MKKFILLSFGFMAWAFYEISGGDDFEPASERHARLNPAPEVVVTEESPAQSDAADADATDVTRVSLNLTSLQDALEADDRSDAVATSLVVTPVIAENENDVPLTDPNLSDPTVTDSASTPAIIASLIVPEDDGTVQNPSLVTSNVQDVREVTGNRVNVRGGPGTEHSVVTKLVRGDAVEILQDNGDGWVLMRPLDGGPEGWMADFLLTAG